MMMKIGAIAVVVVGAVVVVITCGGPGDFFNICGCGCGCGYFCHQELNRRWLKF